MKSVVTLASGLLALVACASRASQSSRVASTSVTALPPPCTASSPQHASADAGAPFPDAAERKALFSDLLAEVRHYHLFSDLTRKNLGRAWEDDLPELKASFARASDALALTEALAHFGHSLHDGHLWYSPAKEVGRGDRLVLGLALEPEWVGGAARYYVSEPPDPKSAAAASGVRAGDIVVSVAGVPGERLTAAHALESSENNWRGVARDVAGYLTARSTAGSATKPGDEETWVLRHRDGGEATVRLAWRKEPWPAGGGGPDDSGEPDIVDVDYAPKQCSVDLADRKYPASYRLASHGRFYCLYVADRAPYDAYPIVRHFSFHYSHLGHLAVSPRFMLPYTGWQVSAEYYDLSAALRKLPKAKGIILDLRENRGGNDPEWFLDWYAPAPYADMFTSVRVFPEYDDPAFRGRVANVDDEWYAWYRKAAAGAAPGSDVRRPFKCVNADCTGENRFTPSHGLLAVPVALLVGPECMSSCAHVAHIFDENDFGPLIGEPTAASYTSQRLSFQVKTRSGLDLGEMRLGLSRDSSGKTGAPLEGYTVHVDYPVERTFEERDAWDAALVDAAVRAFREYKFPKRVAKLGP